MGGRIESLLVVESNPADAYITAEALKQAGMTSGVTVVDSGERALQHLESEPAPDMIFLDLNLTVVSGLEVLKKIRAHPKLRAVPVVMLSGSLNAKDVEDSYMQGANCYITKPASLEEFLRFMQIFYEFWGSVATLPSKMIS